MNIAIAVPPDVTLTERVFVAPVGGLQLTEYVPGLRGTLIDVPLPFEAPFTVKAQLPPTATATKVPMSPPDEGAEVAVGAAVAVAVAVGFAEADAVVAGVLPLPVEDGGALFPPPFAPTGGDAAEEAAGGVSAGGVTTLGVSTGAGVVAGGGVVGSGIVTAAVLSVDADPEPSPRPPKMKRSASAGRSTHAAAIAAIAALRAPAFLGASIAAWGPVPTAEGGGGGAPNEGGPAGTTDDIGVAWRCTSGVEPHAGRGASRFNEGPSTEDEAPAGAGGAPGTAGAGAIPGCDGGRAAGDAAGAAAGAPFWISMPVAAPANIG